MLEIFLTYKEHFKIYTVNKILAQIIFYLHSSADLIRAAFFLYLSPISLIFSKRSSDMCSSYSLSTLAICSSRCFQWKKLAIVNVNTLISLKCLIVKFTDICKKRNKRNILVSLCRPLLCPFLIISPFQSPKTTTLLNGAFLYTLLHTRTYILHL